MYKIIIFLLCVTTVRLKRIDNTQKFRFVGTFNDMGLSSSGIEYPSSNSGVTSRSARLTRAKRSPLMYLVPVNEEHENADNEMTERSRPSRKIKRCKTALCKAANIPLSREYGDGMVKATAGESSGEPYRRSTRWKQIRTPKNSVVSKLFKKETDSSENYEDNDELAESLGKNLANEQNYENNPSNRRYREKSGKFVCYCQREDCPDCRSSDSRKELVGASQTRENALTKDKFKKDRYRKLLRPNDYAMPKIPLVRLPELYREIPYDLRRNRGNANKMDILPIVRGIPSNVHPLTAPFRVAYDPADTYLGTSGPVSQQYQQKFNDIYQHVPLKQYTVASKSKSGIPRRPSISISENNGVASRNNDFTAIRNHPKGNGGDKNIDAEESIEDDAFDSNMRECIKLFGRKVCVLAASANCDNLNKVQNQGGSDFSMESNKNVGSARNYYETSSSEQSSTLDAINEDYYDVTESDIVSNNSPYNIINVGEAVDDHRIPTEQSLGNYYDDYYDSTVAYVTSETPEYVTSGIRNDEIFNNDYYDSESPKYVNVDSTEAAILGEASNQKEETTTILDDTNSNNNVGYKTSNLENESNCNSFSQNSSNSIKVGDEKLNNTVLTSENESSTYSQNQNNNHYKDFISTTTEIADETSTDTILGNDRNHYTEETHPALDYSDIQVVTNGYFTSKGYDVSDENYFTGLDPTAYDYHLPNDGSTNFLENAPSHDINLQATNIPGIVKDQNNLLGTSPTKSYSDLSKSRFFTDPIIDNNFIIDTTTTEDAIGVLEKEQTNCENQEHKMDDQQKESALQGDQLDSDAIITTESESQKSTTDSFVGYAIPSLDYITHKITTSDPPTSSEISTPIESTDNEEIVTIDDYTIREAILMTEKNPVEHQSLEDMTDNKETTTAITTIYDKNEDSTVGFPNESFSESTNSMINEENSSEGFDTTIVNDEGPGISGNDDNVSNNFQAEATTQHLPFCDNTVLINSIRKVINNFTMNSPSLEESYVSTDAPNEELSPEILEIPNLRSFLSLPQIENVIVKNVKDHLSKFAGLSKNALIGARPGEMIRNALRNILGVLPKTQPELPPMTVVEHQFQNDQWTTNLVTLVPIDPDEETENQNSLQKIHEHIKDLIFNPVIGLQAAKQNAVQNIIVQAVKHQIENTNGLVVEEDTIRDMVGNVLGDAIEKEQNENEENNFKSSMSMEDATKQLEEETNYDEEMITEGNALEDFYTNLEQVTVGLPLITNLNDIETTTDLTTQLYTEDLVGNPQVSSTEVNEKNNNSSDDLSLSKGIPINCLNQDHSDQDTIDRSTQNSSIDVKPTTAPFTEDFLGSIQFSSTEMNKERNDLNTNQNLDQNQPVDYANRVNSGPVTVTIPITSDIIDVKTTTMSSTESYPEFSTTRINEETDSTDSQNLGKEQASDSSNVNSEQPMITMPVETDTINTEATTIIEFSSTEINDKNNDLNLNKEESSNNSNYSQSNNFSTSTNSYIENFQGDNHTESTDISETTKDITNIDEEIKLGVPYRDQQRSSETTKKNKGETNESEVLSLPQNSFAGADNTGIGENSSTNQGRSSQGKEKCRLCKMESCTSTHEIVTKVHKRVKTTTKKYYGAKENVASEGNPIVSSKHQEDHSTVVSLESQEEVDRSNNRDDDVSTTCENLSEENLRDSVSDEDVVYKEKISKKKTYGDDKDDLSDLQNSELYYIGDNVKLPLEIKKLKDGSYALSISKSICENVLKRKCPCCVPLDGNVRSVRRSPAINGNTDRVARTRKSTNFKPKPLRKRTRRSTTTNKGSNWVDSIFKNELKTLTMPVTSFAKKYNLRLNLDDAEIENSTADQIKRANKIDKDIIDVGSKKRLLEQTNEIARDKNKFEEEIDIYHDDDNQIENIDINNPVFQRMKFVNRMRQNPELYRHQRAIEAIPNDKTEILKSLLNWLRALILH